jgi:hypothetical protein
MKPTRLLYTVVQEGREAHGTARQGKPGYEKETRERACDRHGPLPRLRSWVP